MIKYLVLIALLASGALPAFAKESLCLAQVSFHRVFATDIDGGKYQVGEDREISERFQKTGIVRAEFKIREPHRTKQFGSGVAFLFCDAGLGQAIRVSFNDSPQADKARLTVLRFTGDTVESKTIVAASLVPGAKNASHVVTFRRNKEGKLVIGVGGDVFKVDPGFDLQGIKAQIFCSDSEVRFLDGELTS